MKFSLSFVSETTKLQIEKVKLLIVRIGLGVSRRESFRVSVPRAGHQGAGGVAAGETSG